MALSPKLRCVQGNWGNALMAYGILKKRYLNALREFPPPLSPDERAAMEDAEAQIMGATLLVACYSEVPCNLLLVRLI
jgi:hypothetical protein